jgi:hypothetical protein
MEPYRRRRGLHPVVGAVDNRDYLPPPLGRYMPSTFGEFVLLYGMNEITTTQSGPVQPVPAVEDDLMRFWRPISLLAGTHQNIQILFVGDPFRMRHDYCGMRFWPAGRGKAIDVPRFQSRSSRVGANRRPVIVPSSLSHSLSAWDQHSLHSAAVKGVSFVADNCSTSLGNPNFVLWRMTSAMERPVRRAAARTSFISSAGTTNG